MIDKRVLYSPKNVFLPANMKAIAIALICYAHIPPSAGFTSGASFPDFMNILITPFGMPVFAFMSGFFDKNTGKGIAANVDFVFKCVTLYLVAFFISNLCIIFLGSAPITVDSVVSRFCNVLHGGYLWYFQALIIWKIFTPFLSRLKYSTVVVLLLGFASVFFNGSDQFDSIMRAIFRYLPFYFIGINISWEKIVEMRISNKRWYYLLLLPLAAAICLIVKKYFNTGTSDFKSLGNYYSIAAVYFSYLVLSFSVIVVFLSFLSGRRIKFITEFGERSLSIYVFHPIICFYLMNLLVYPSLKGMSMWVFGAVQILLILFTCLLFSRNVFYVFLTKSSTKLYEIILKKE